MASGWPVSFEISSEEVMFALIESIKKIVAAVRRVYERTPPELGSDIREEGILLTGGGSLLYGLDSCFRELIGLQAFVAENALDCVAIGTGRCFSSFANKRSKNNIKHYEKLYEGKERSREGDTAKEIEAEAEVKKIKEKEKRHDEGSFFDKVLDKISNMAQD